MTLPKMPEHVLKRIVLPGEFDGFDETDRSLWLGVMDQCYQAGLLRAAEIAEQTYPERVNGQDVTLPCFETSAEVADAIRKEAQE